MNDLKLGSGREQRTGVIVYSFGAILKGDDIAWERRGVARAPGRRSGR